MSFNNSLSLMASIYDVEHMQKALSLYPELDINKIVNNDTLLSSAVLHKNTEVVKELLQHKDINPKYSS